jgi:hypothetical protein
MCIVHNIFRKSVFIGLLLLSSLVFSQSTQDLKEYIKSNITRYPSGENIRNYAIFTDDILQLHLRVFTGKEVSDIEFQNIFIFGAEIHKGNSILNDVQAEFVATIDLRAIRKIETLQNPKSEPPNSKLLLYLREGFLSKAFYKEDDNEEVKELGGIMEITIDNNENVTEKLKKAFIKLGENLNINIKDGDLF